MMKTYQKLLLAAIACFLLLFAAPSSLHPVQASATSQVLDLGQIEQAFARAIQNGSNTVTFTAGNYTTAQLQAALERAAKSQNRLLAGSVQINKRTNGSGSIAEYQILLSDDALMKIRPLKSEAAARKAAANALKNSKYSANFYSDTSYYEIFRRMLQQHPEYNYGTVLWRSTNGSYGYHRSNSLTKKQQQSKTAAADTAAANAVSQCIRADMTDKQKARAIHNYLLRHCSYDERTANSGDTNRYQDAFTAYGALVKGSAVCQGYAAAFNLMAQKCGLQSMSVRGSAGGVSHAWNYVKLGKKYRYIDCTWDDTIQGQDKIRYDYFNATAVKMREQHVWQEAEFPASDIKYSKYFM